MKFSKVDDSYFQRRREFADNLPQSKFWSVVDHWPLYVGSVNLARNLAIVDLLRSTLSVPGHIAEFGCWKGSTSLLLAKALKIYDPNSPKLLHLFDSFEGLTEFQPKDLGAIEQAGDYQGSREHLELCAQLAEVEDAMVIHQGLIEVTLPEFVAVNRGIKFSFIYCDTDLYSATRVILEALWGALSVGGLIVFDQWNMDEFPGEGTAVNEFISEVPGTFEMIKPEFTRQPTLALRRLS